MPSLLDLLEGGDEAPEPATRPEQPPAVPPAAISSERRWPVVGQRRLTALVVALALAAGALVAVQRIGDGDDQAQVKVTTDDTGVLSDFVIDPAPTLPTIDPVPTPATTAEPSPSNPPVTAAELKATTPTAGSSATTATPPSSSPAPASTTAPPVTARTTTTRRVCRNSTEPTCGPFGWDPEPAPNQLLKASFSHPKMVAVGEVFEFKLVWSDGDADLSYDHLALDGRAVPAPCDRIDRYGPWNPPAVRPASGTKTYRRSFGAAGTYEVVVDLRTGDCTSPYSDDVQIRTTIEVTEAPAPS